MWSLCLGMMCSYWRRIPQSAAPSVTEGHGNLRRHNERVSPWAASARLLVPPLSRDSSVKLYRPFSALIGLRACAISCGLSQGRGRSFELGPLVVRAPARVRSLIRAIVDPRLPSGGPLGVSVWRPTEQYPARALAPALLV
jgi:hypothetical protein